MERVNHAVRRCAVYTRKSSEEGSGAGLQLAACPTRGVRGVHQEPAGEGWKLVKTAYDDGGLSGGTMERPALQRLLDDIRQG